MSKTAPLAKLPPGGSYLFMKYDVFIQNAEFFLGIELISFNVFMVNIYVSSVPIFSKIWG